MNQPISLGFLPQKTIVLVGTMGVGKTSVGRRLAKQLSTSFSDSDQEVELAAGCTINDIYDLYGENAFWDAEYRVINRVLSGPPQVLATGVGAFGQKKTQELIQGKGLSVWLQADVKDILSRVSRRSHRPQIQEGNLEETIQTLLKTYEPAYKQAHISVACDKDPAKTVTAILQSLQSYQSDGGTL
ncbi:shikimate kinase [Alphaproteobacteria bacterium]|nr:shikimate kinase [Alphaproteobacteria bacterium]